MAFVHFHAPAAVPAAGDLCLVIEGDRILVRPDAQSAVGLPDFGVLAGWAETPRAPVHVGRIDDRACWLLPVGTMECVPPSGWEWQDTRGLIGLFTPEEWHAVNCARQLAWWERHHRFCGGCGTPTVGLPEERARRCPQCGALFFPSASPAVIVAITRGDELLLAHNRNFRAGMFSLLAGFVDPGETLEQAVAREVREEVAVEIAGLRYVTSQPWAFPNSLMVGFRAVHMSGELAVDGKEIETAGWFRRDALPEIPRVGTVARLMIDAWCRE
jgi:NAD+ diphosphatase